MAEDRIREMAGDGADIEERTLKLSGSDVRNGTRRPVNISLRNGAISVSIARIDAQRSSFLSEEIVHSIMRQIRISVTFPRTQRFGMQQADRILERLRTDRTEKFVGAGRFLCCVSGLKSLKYQTKTIGAIRAAITTIA
jgi:hypothetical protein